MTTESVRGRFHKFGVGDRLRAAREIAGLSQDELSQLTGINRQTISNYELGISKRPKSPYVAAIALATNFDKDWIENGTVPDPDGDGDGGARSPGDFGATPTGQYGDLPFNRLLHLPDQWLVAAQSDLRPAPKIIQTSTLTQASLDRAA